MLQNLACQTVTGNRVNVQCKFPFEYRGKRFYECTFYPGIEFPWCSTKNANGVHIEGEWGYCHHRCEHGIYQLKI